MIGDYLTDSEITVSAKLSRPDYVGVVLGAQYKLEAIEDGITEYALVLIGGGVSQLFEMSKEDLRYLGKQITGLIDG